MPGGIVRVTLAGVMADLVIVESPGKTRNVNQILGSGYVVRASLGHVRDLRQPKRDGRGSGQAPDRPGAGHPRRLEAGLGDHRLAVKVVRELSGFRRDGVVWLATDLDREG